MSPMNRSLFFSALIATLCAVPAPAQLGDVTDAANAASTGRISTNLAWGDYDGDGDYDLYVTNWAEAFLGDAINALFQNNGDGTFTNVTDAAALGANNFLPAGGNSTAAAWGDYDNDGDVDLYVADFFGQDALLENDGGTFTEFGRAEGQIDLEKRGSETSVAWGDYDGDGFLDLYLGAYYYENELYENNDGDGTFTQVTDQSALNDKRDTNDVNWVDYDNDGDPDLFVVNREQENALYRNDLETTGSFEEVFCALSLSDLEIGHKAAWADYDNDGRLDVFVANAGANALYRNDGSDTFINVAAAAGVRHSGSSWRTAAVAWSDYDGDGDFDLFLASGREDSFQDARGQTDVLYANQGDGTFYNSEEAAIGRSNRYHAAAAFADYDGNATPDLYVIDAGGLGAWPPSNLLLQNAGDQGGGNPTDRFIRVRVTGRGAGGTNRDGIGAQVRLLTTTGDTLSYQQVMNTPNAPELIFGTPFGFGTYTVQVFFPNSSTTVSIDTLPGEDPLQITEP